MVTTSRNNDLEYLTGSPPMYTRWVPQNQSFAILCLPNSFAIEFTGSKYLRTTDYALMNSMTLSQFTWEASVLHRGLTGKQVYLSWHNSAGSYFMTFHKSANNQLEFSVKTSSSTITATSRIKLEIGKWYHVAVTYDGGIAGQLRLYYLDPYGSIVTGSDCTDDVCLSGALHGTVGERGKGFGFGVSKLSGTLSGCTVGLTLSAHGGGVCDTGYVGQVCHTDSDCGGGLVTGTCKVGSGFSATIVEVVQGTAKIAFFDVAAQTATLDGGIDNAVTQVVMGAAIANLAANEFIKIGTEYMKVLVLSNGGKTLTVIRNQNPDGLTSAGAAAHSNGETITLAEGGVDTSATELKIATAIPNLAANEFIQAGTEYMKVTALADSGKTLTVVRNQNPAGLTSAGAATHAGGETVTLISGSITNIYVTDPGR
jgi:hypothetical protein